MPAPSTSASAPVAAAAEWERLDAYAAPLAAIDAADLVLVVGDAEPADRAGTVDLRIRKARRAGAHLAIAGPGGTSLEPDARTFLQTRPGAASAVLAGLVAGLVEVGGAHVRADASPAGTVDALAALAGADATALRSLAAALAAAERPVVLVTDEVAVAEVEALAWVAGLDRTDGGVVPLPVGANERGERAVGIVGGWDEVLPAVEAGEVLSIVFVGADPVLDSREGERWQMALARAEHVVSVAPFTNGVSAQSQLVLPLDVDHERDGTVVNLEGRVQRLRPSLPPIAGATLLEWTSRLGGFMSLTLDANAGRVFDALAAANPAFAGLRWSELGERADLHRTRPAAAAPAGVPAPAAPPAADDGRAVLIAPRMLMRGQAAARTASLAHQRAPYVVLAHADAERLGVKRGDEVAVRHAAGEHIGEARISRRLMPGAVRINWLGALGTGDAATVEAR